MNKASEEGAMSPLATVLRQGAPKLPDRPGDPSLTAPVEDMGNTSPDTRKLTIADKGMDGNEIKMSVESSKENDDRINFLLNAFTQKTKDGEDTSVPSDEEAVPEPAEEAPVLPAQEELPPIV